MRREIVVSGVGVVSPFGIGVGAFWDGLCSGESRLGPIRAFDASANESKLAAEIPEVKARDFVPKSYRKAVKVMARDTEIAVVAAAEAVREAGLVTKASDEGEPTYAGNRIGCQIGAGLIAAELDELNAALVTAASEGVFSYAEWGEKGMQNLTPLWMLKYLPNMLACHVTIIHDARGPSNTITCGEASALLSIGESARVIERGDADIAFAGGAESKVNPTGVMRMQLAGLAGATGEQSDGASFIRPFDQASGGSLLGEGGGILLLEDAAKARARGADASVVLEGFGAGQTPAGESVELRADGMIAAVEAALADAGRGSGHGVDVGDIDAVVVGGIGEPSRDEAEAFALRAVLGDRMGQVELVTLTPQIGNAVAGQGGLQAAAAVRMLREQRLPARVHAGQPSGGLKAGAASSREASLRRVLVLSSSTGGQNAAAVFARRG